MTRIVKSSAVVDDRPVRPQQPGTMENLIGSQSVLKSYLFSGNVSAAYPQTPPPSRQGLNDELNRLKLDIEAAKKELRSLGREIRDTRQAREDAAQSVAEDEAYVEDAAEQAQALLEQARAQADTILLQAQAQGSVLAEQAKNDGYLEGFSKGYEEASQEFRNANEPQAALIGNLLQRLEGYEKRLTAREAEHLVSLAMAVAEKIVRRTLKEDPMAVADMLRDVVEQNSHEEYVKITLSPDLLPIQAQVSDQVRDILAATGANVTVLTDSGMGSGGVRLETPKGLVDVSIQTQLDNLHSILNAE